MLKFKKGRTETVRPFFIAIVSDEVVLRQN